MSTKQYLAQGMCTLCKKQDKLLVMYIALDNLPSQQAGWLHIQFCHYTEVVLFQR